MAGEDSRRMGEARFAAIVAAFGSDPRRWPAAEREAALFWLASSPAAEALLSSARELDQALGEADLARPSSVLKERLLSDFQQAARRRSLAKLLRLAADRMWPGVPAWQPACALVLAFIIGSCLALFVPLEIAQPDGASFDSFALDAAPDFDAGPGI